MRRFLIHYVIVINDEEKKISSVFSDYLLPITHDGYLDVDAFCENEKEVYIAKYLSDIPEVHVISISEVPKLRAEPNY